MDLYNPRNAQFIVVIYLFDLWIKAFLGFPFAIVLDALLCLLFIRLLINRVPYYRFFLLMMVFCIFWMVIIKMIYGIPRMPLMLFLMVFLTLDFVEKNVNIYLIIKYLKTYLAMLVFFIVADGIFINFIGGPDILINILGPAGYRTSANGVFFDSIAQGLVPGTQHASIISCAGIIMFYPFIKNDKSIKNRALFFLSIIGLIFSITNTALIALTLSIILFMLITFRPSISNIFKISVMSFLVLVLINFGYLWLTMRYEVLANASSLDIDIFLSKTVDIFFSPLVNLMKLPLVYALIGIGHSSIPGSGHFKIMEQYNFEIYYADFGYLNMLLEHGIITLFIMFSLYSYYFIYVGRVVRNIPDSIQKVLMSKMMLVVNIFVLSGIHYTTITKNGIIQFVIIIGVSAFILARRYNQKYFNSSISFSS